MGKQMTYYMEREVFTQLAQIAVDLGCVILKQNGSKIISGDTSIIDSHCSKYYFYLPAAGEINEELPLGCRSEERRVGKECRSRWSPYH